MRRINRVLCVVSLLTLGLLVIPLTSQADRMRSGGYRMMGGDMMSQLSPEEQKTVEELGQKYYGQMMDLRKQIFAKRAELNAVMAQEKFDAKKARILGKEIRLLQDSLHEKHLEMLIEMREKGVSYYGTCMTGGKMGRHMMGRGMMGQPMMMDDGMMEQEKSDTDKE